MLNLPDDLINYLYEYVSLDDIINVEVITKREIKKYSPSESAYKDYYLAQQLVKKTKKIYLDAIKEEMKEKKNYERITEYITLYKEIEGTHHKNYYLNYYEDIDGFMNDDIFENPNKKDVGLFGFEKPWLGNNRLHDGWYEKIMKEITEILIEITGVKGELKYYLPYFSNSGMVYYTFKLNPNKKIEIS